MFLQPRFPFAVVFLPHLGLHIFLLSFLIYSIIKFRWEISIYIKNVKPFNELPESPEFFPKIYTPFPLYINHP